MTGSRASAARSALVRSAIPGASSNAGSASAIAASARIDPGRHRLGMAVEGAVQGQVHPRRHGAQGVRLGAEVAAGRLGATAEGVEVAQRGHGQGPPAGAVGQRLLDEPEIPPLPGPAHQRRRHVVEAGAVEGLQEVDGRVGTVAAATGRPTGRRGPRSRARWPARRRAPTPPGPGAAATPRMVASVNGASWASRRASVHTARPSSSSSRPERDLVARPAGSGARRPISADRRPGGPAGRSPRPPGRAGRAGRAGAPRPAGAVISVGASRCHSLDRAVREPRLNQGAQGLLSLRFIPSTADPRPPDRTTESRTGEA